MIQIPSRGRLASRLALAGMVTLLATEAAAAPPAPSQPTATCVATVGGKCYVTTSTTISASSPGAHHYRICRSNDTTGWGGCDVVITQNTQMPYTVTGSHLPGDGFRRAYYVSACDASGSCTSWASTAPVYVYRDISVPSVGATTVSSPAWRVDRTQTYGVTATATDSGSGVKEIRSVINLLGSNSSNPRGFFSWRQDSYAFTKDRRPCTGGGWASMNPTLHGATRVTLVGCQTSLIGSQRQVTFTVRPNETFGVFGAINDVATRAWDFVNNSTAWTQFNINFSSFRPNDSLGDRIGYQGILDPAGLDQADAEGIGVNLATLLLQRRTCAPYYWQTVNSAAILSNFASRNVKTMVILENFLFKNVNDTVNYNDNCSPTPPPPAPQTTTCKNGNLWKRLPDWKPRLDLFDSLHGAAMTPQNVAFFLISSEVNDRCFDLTEVREVAAEVKSRYPAIPVGFFYGATHDIAGNLASEPPPWCEFPPPASCDFPAVFDIVGLFSYEIFDVTNPLEARNSTGSYYNPENPTDPSTVYGDLLGKLQPNQKVLLVFDSDYNGGPDPCVGGTFPCAGGAAICGNAAQGWCATDLAEVANHYAEFMTFRPEVTMLGGFTWQSLLTLPQSVRDNAAVMACDFFDNNSWLCN